MSQRKKGKRRGRKKGSKKSWRKNGKSLQDTAETQEPEKPLFFIDKNQTPLGNNTLPKSQLKELHKEKLLSYEKTLPTNYKEKLKQKQIKYQSQLLKEATKIANQKSNRKKQKKSNNNKSNNVDIWGTNKLEENNKNNNDKNEWLEDTLAIKKSIKVPKSVQQVKDELPQIPAVEIVSSGYSYNPSYDEHQDVLGEAVAEVLEKEAKEQRLENKLRKPKLTKNNNNNDIKDINDINDDSNNNNENTNEEVKEKVHNPWSTKYSTTKRNKLKRKRLNEIAKIRKERRKKRNIEWSNYSKLVKGIELELKEHEENLRQRKKRKVEESKTKIRKLGKHKFEEMPKQVMLSEELPDSLRTLTPKSDLLTERFKSMQKRNLIPAYPSRKDRGGKYRRPNKKRYEKYDFSHWEFVY